MEDYTALSEAMNAYVDLDTITVDKARDCLGELVKRAKAENQGRSGR